jgi:hypothetical protein
VVVGHGEGGERYYSENNEADSVYTGSSEIAIGSAKNVYPVCINQRHGLPRTMKEFPIIDHFRSSLLFRFKHFQKKLQVSGHCMANCSSAFAQHTYVPHNKRTVDSGDGSWSSGFFRQPVVILLKGLNKIRYVSSQ